MMLNIDKRLQGREKKLEDSFSVMQKVSNKVVTLERQQAQGNKAHQLQYQTPNNGSPQIIIIGILLLIRVGRIVMLLPQMQIKVGP